MLLYNIYIYYEVHEWLTLAYRKHPPPPHLPTLSIIVVSSHIYPFHVLFFIFFLLVNYLVKHNLGPTFKPRVFSFFEHVVNIFFFFETFAQIW